MFLLVLGIVEHLIALGTLAAMNLNVPLPTLGQTLKAELQYASNTYIAAAGLMTALRFWQQQQWAEERALDLMALLSSSRLAAL